MITKQVSTLGFDLNFSVPETVDEYDQLAKKVGACLESAVLNVVYRSTFAKFRANFAEAVANNTGIKRNEETVLGADGNPKKDEDGNEVTKYTETEKVYFDRVCAQLVKDGKLPSVEAAAASFQALAQTTIETIAFDPSESERVPTGPKKVAKAYILLAQDAESKGKLSWLADQLRAKLANWTVEATVDSVAKAVAEDKRRQREATKLNDEYGV
jgi:hypothetical protein